MKKFDLNIVMLTYRSDLIARQNLSIALETVIHHSNARLIVGYGGVDDEYYSWIHGLQCRVDQKSSFESITEVSITERLKWALEFPSEWIIFISDDDIFGANYLSIFIKEIGMADNSVANIFPKYYGINRGSDVEFIRFPNISDAEPYDRAKSFMSESISGIRYYSAHRAKTVKEIIKESHNINYCPSYLDQLIVLSSLVNGKSISCGEPNILIYNMENWANLESCIKSDAKFYKTDKLVFFHEILWVGDYVNVLHPHCTDDLKYEWIKSYCLGRLSVALNTFIPRLELIRLNNLQATAILDEITRLFISISNCQNINDLKGELIQCKSNLLNEATSRIYFGEDI